MGTYSSISIIIPSLSPTDRLEKVVAGLTGAGFDDIIVVNDGSAAEFSAIYDRLDRAGGCVVLTHDTNMGKGAALKTAFGYFAATRLDKTGAITVDADGQHSIQDVLKCAEAIIGRGDDDYVVMGVRNFRHSAVPRRNSLGNRVSSFALRLLFGFGLRDTQTGLRGIPAKLVSILLDVPGSRFEYETNMLLEFKRLDIPFVEIPIETIYEEGSDTRSNFRPLRDSAMILARILKYALSSIACFLVDIGVFALAMLLLRHHLGVWDILCCTVIARVISSFLNFNINRLLVFRHKKTYGSHFLRYYALAAVQMLASAGGLWLLSLPFGGGQPVGFIALLKVLLDITLFFVSYFVQHRWVYR